MLVLSRKTGESLMIGDNIVVTILNAGQNQVRIGIRAPQEIAVHREEIYLRLEMEANSSSDGHLQCSTNASLERLEREL